MLYVARKRGLPRKFARLVQLKSVLLRTCVFWIFFQNAGSQPCFRLFFFSFPKVLRYVSVAEPSSFKPMKAVMMSSRGYARFQLKRSKSWRDALLWSLRRRLRRLRVQTVVARRATD